MGRELKPKPSNRKGKARTQDFRQEHRPRGRRPCPLRASPDGTPPKRPGQEGPPHGKGKTRHAPPGQAQGRRPHRCHRRAEKDRCPLSMGAPPHTLSNPTLWSALYRQEEPVTGDTVRCCKSRVDSLV